MAKPKRKIALTGDVDLPRDIPTLIVTVGFISVGLAAVHEWGFFQIIGLHYLLFSSPTDYLTTVFSWLPIAIGILISALVFHKTIPRFSYSTKIVNSSYFWVGFSIIFVAVLTRVFGPVVNFYSLLAILLLYLCLYAYYFHNAPLEYNSYLLAALLAVTLSYVTGTGDATRKGEQQDRSKILLKNETVEIEVFVLRNFDKGILIEDAKRNEIRFYPWSEIKYISDSLWTKRHTSIACMISNRLCSSRFSIIEK
jgi:hypothetical protein